MRSVSTPVARLPAVLPSAPAGAPTDLVGLADRLAPRAASEYFRSMRAHKLRGYPVEGARFIAYDTRAERDPALKASVVEKLFAPTAEEDARFCALVKDRIQKALPELTVTEVVRTSDRMKHVQLFVTATNIPG